MKVEKGQLYMHKNGKFYSVVCLATRNESDEMVTSVIHKGVEDGRIWDRTLDNFTEPGRFTQVYGGSA